MPVNVLIVDDSSAVRMILRRVLGHAQLPIGAVTEAGDGLQALEKMQEGGVGLVLLDVNMPNMDGIEFLEKLRADPANQAVRVLMITTEGSADKVTKALEQGANGYIKKPFTADQIHEKVAQLF